MVSATFSTSVDSDVPSFRTVEIASRLPDGAMKGVKTPIRMRQILDKLQQENREIFRQSPAYDGKKNLYSSLEIGEENFTVKMSKDPNANRGIFYVRLRRVGVIRPQDLDMLTRPDGLNNSATTAVATNLLQVIVSQSPNIQHHFALHSKSFYIGAATTLSGGLEAWRGFFQSVRPILNKIVINVDTSTAAIYASGNLLSMAMAYFNHRDVRAFIQECERDPSAARRLRTFYKGVFVKVMGREREFKIEDVVESAGTREFHKGDHGEVTTVERHFWDHHRVRLSHPKAFGVRVSKTAIYPAEVCQIVPAQLYKKTLSGADTTKMMSVSTARPEKRLQDIQQAVAEDKMGYKSSPWVLDAEMAIETAPMEAPGRVLNPPNVVYGGAVTANVNSGGWNVMRMRFHQPARIVAWAVVSFDVSRGITFTKGQPVFAAGNQANPYESLLQAAQEATKDVPGRPKPGLLVVILPQSAGPLRKAVKQWGDMVEGIPTQCVRADKYETANDQYCNNVALKINARTGGVNSVARSPELAFFKDCMVVGCDVAHPSPGVRSRPSIASLVASADEFATRYTTEVRVQPPRQEAIESIGPMMEAIQSEYCHFCVFAHICYRAQNALEEYQGYNKGRSPAHILLYRDGVSEGEYSQVEDGEIKDIEDTLDRWHSGHSAQPKPKLIFVIVTKRHHVRFFPRNRGDADRTGNAPSGLVVDREAVHSKYMDFYLQSQGGLKGTSRPSHYTVLRNDAGLTADQLQEISFALCHVYASATRAVSIPAPVYYADRLCARADFQFRPELAYADEGASSAGAGAFDLAPWEKGLGQAKLYRQMYFL
ncbi:hypothetical protein PHLGIDRAFT_116659 [Phlebiopsis gigantea 11061_1 CR5-6]|uniref:Piwi domain-containing protein n=1 Tax=Phlebiopsis gigantea (strain 11061_1 CR5-6) TaxID=745531 RepID=A0A0C3SCT3_PHLG1|nr:hypothetical protein PHLGIDRAFT_116659 [Phlebiopsis gigantea 11061_1 CR5-6]